MQEQIPMTVEAVRKQERTLRFIKFTQKTAWTLGQRLVRKADSRQAAVAIDISLNGQQVFHYAFPGTTPDNDRWLAMKANVTKLTHTSSLLAGLAAASWEVPAEQGMCLDPRQYSASGGAFPITVTDVGCVGVIGVSGLSPEQDHLLITDTLAEFLADEEEV